jgi:hypothetical protein
LPSVGTIMPISGAPRWSSKPRKNGSITFARCETSVSRGGLRKQDGLISQSPSQKRT